jgi:hypothetical protein
MTFRKKTDPFKRILAIVIGVVFFVTLAAISYEALQSNTDARSRAGQTNLTYKIWDFTTNEEGWSGQNLTKFGALNGILSATIGSKIGSVINSTVNTGMPLGNKYITIRMAVSASPVLGESTTCVVSSNGTTTCLPVSGNNAPGQTEGSFGSAGSVGDRIIRDESPYIPQPNTSCVPQPTCPPNEPDCVLPYLVPVGGWCPTGTSPVPSPARTKTPSPKPVNTSFSFYVSVWKTGEDSSFESNNRLIQLRGVADGVMRDYTLLIPEVNAMTISKIEIRFSSGVNAGGQVNFDTISLVGPPKPTPTTVSCTRNRSKCTISICPTMPVCPAGKMCSQEMPPCTTQNGICKNHVCVVSPTPTPLAGECKSCTNTACPNGLVCRSFPIGAGGCTDDGSGHRVCFEPAVSLLCVKPNGTSNCPISTSLSQCTGNNECPTGSICSAVPPGGCPSGIVNGVEVTTKCATAPRCWPINPTTIPAPKCTGSYCLY